MLSAHSDYHGDALGSVEYKFWLTFPTNNLTDPANTILHRIDYRADAVPPGELQYTNFTPIVGQAAQAEFGKQFILPDVCQGNDVHPCDE